MLLRNLRFLLVGVVLAPPCLLPWQVQISEPTVSAHQDQPDPASQPTSSLFDDAAAEFSVPLDALRAHATNGVDRQAGVATSVRRFGPMGLREGEGVENEVAQAAALLGVTADAVKNDPRTNVRAAAALLRAQRTRVRG
jgi:hypothetical protein